MNESYARVTVEIRCWGCRQAVRDLMDMLNLEFVYPPIEGGFFIFEYINCRVRGKESDIKQFIKILENKIGE